MLTYLLALIVGFSSFALYMAGFFFPELYRKYDLVWSGVAMFYALILWNDADRIRGGVLLGQIAIVALLGWFSWQALGLRWEQTPIEQRTQVAEVDGSLSDVVKVQSQRLWDYLQSERFQSQLPSNFDEFLEQSKRLFATAKVWIVAAFQSISQSLQSLPESQAVPPTGEAIEPASEPEESGSSSAKAP
ncbi:MAG: hypothetical protein Kow00121_38740 [Elainellaceae cyanobacterium]